MGRNKSRDSFSSTARDARLSTASRSLVNGDHVVRDVIVIGGSAGGIEVLIRVLAELPPGLPAIVCVVVHRSPCESQLAPVLGQRAHIPVMEACTHMKLMQGCVYLAPPDHHLELGKNRLLIRRSEKEHSTRPAIDPLFRSAAQSYGRRVAGILLSGGGEDGVNGLILIKQYGGISLAQDPHDAQIPFLPLNALRYDHPDCLLSTDTIASTLIALAHGQAVKC